MDMRCPVEMVQLASNGVADIFVLYSKTMILASHISKYIVIMFIER